MDIEEERQMAIDRAQQQQTQNEQVQKMYALLARVCPPEEGTPWEQLKWLVARGEGLEQSLTISQQLLAKVETLLLQQLPSTLRDASFEARLAHVAAEIQRQHSAHNTAAARIEELEKREEELEGQLRDAKDERLDARTRASLAESRLLTAELESEETELALEADLEATKAAATSYRKQLDKWRATRLQRMEARMYLQPAFMLYRLLKLAERVKARKQSTEDIDQRIRDFIAGHPDLTLFEVVDVATEHGERVTFDFKDRLKQAGVKES